MEYNQISVLGERVSPSDRQEVALLIDHLSLAKEENREILRLTHESMSRLSEMTDKMLDMKDSIISSKDEQMQILKQRLAEQTEQLRQVLREKEDLETLTEALQKS
jgi:pilus assembly protein TadC